MNDSPAILAYIASALFVILTVIHTVKKGKDVQKTFLSTSFFLVTLVEFFMGRMLSSRTPAGVMLNFKLSSAFAIVFPAFSMPFALALSKRNYREIYEKFLAWIAIGIAATAIAAVLAPAGIFLSEIHFTDSGRFWGISFTQGGKIFLVYLILANIFIMFFLENAYKAASVPGKVTLKYPLLGIVSASIINIVILSRALALSVMDFTSIAIESAGFIILAVSLLYATVRYGIFETHLYIGREAATSAITVTISALYLLALGIISVFARALNLPFDRLTGTVLGLFAVFLLVAVLVSGRAKRRLKQFVNENFYPASYNYRREWRRYSELMASSTEVEELISNVISSLCDTMFAKRGLIWVDVEGGKSDSYGFDHIEISRDDATAIIGLNEGKVLRTTKQRGVSFIKRKKGSADAPSAEVLERFDWIRIVAFIGRSGQPLGFIALGDKHINSNYTSEDSDFLATIADETSLALENLLFEERIIESRQMESFNRFASFVIHDLKNTVGMLSLLIENAWEHIGEPEFQKDAVETIQRSVEKMKSLIDSLRSHTSPMVLKKEKADLAKIARDTVSSIKEVARLSGIEITLKAENGLEVKADPAALRRVLENIVINAIEASNEGQTVNISVERAGDLNRVTVTDEGPGFDGEYLSSYLFKPFHSTKKNGLGIGLFLCKSIVENHGGTLAVESEEGKGSTITITLPADTQ